MENLLVGWGGGAAETKIPRERLPATVKPICTSWPTSIRLIIRNPAVNAAFPLCRANTAGTGGEAGDGTKVTHAKNPPCSDWRASSSTVHLNPPRPSAHRDALSPPGSPGPRQISVCEPSRRRVNAAPRSRIIRGRSGLQGEHFLPVYCVVFLLGAPSPNSGVRRVIHRPRQRHRCAGLD